MSCNQSIQMSQSNKATCQQVKNGSRNLDFGKGSENQNMIIPLHRIVHIKIKGVLFENAYLYCLQNSITFFFWLILQYDDLNPTKTKGRTKVVYELNKRRKSPVYCYYCTVAHYRNSTCTELPQISLMKIYPTVSSSSFPCFLLMQSCKLSESFKS